MEERIEDIAANDMRIGELFSTGVVLKEDKFTNKEGVRRAILGRIGVSRQHSIRRTWMVAASIMLVMLTTTAHFITNREFVSDENTLALSLPDGSRVEMQKTSRLSYNRIAWLWSRSVDFNGEAYFTVAKGGQFTVNTDCGSIAVLGTEFQVQAAAQTLAVKCFSGSVCAKAESGEQILRQGEKVEFSPSGMIFTPAIELLPDFLEFDNVPLSDVVSRIEMLYRVEITPADSYGGIIYDGLLPTGNLNETLEMVFSSCGMTYTINGDKIHVSSYAGR